eukprot:2538743-Pleurochrysis_carterae.AAC.5
MMRNNAQKGPRQEGRAKSSPKRHQHNIHSDRATRFKFLIDRQNQSVGLYVPSAIIMYTLCPTLSIDEPIARQRGANALHKRSVRSYSTRKARYGPRSDADFCRSGVNAETARCRGYQCAIFGERSINDYCPVKSYTKYEHRMLRCSL